MKRNLKTMLKNFNIHTLLIKLLGIQILIMVSFASYAQKYYMEAGLPFIQNFTSQEYKAHNQNFSIISDNRGVMYFGNFAGILEFDGTHWQIIQTNNKTRITSLNKDSKGRILVGSKSEFGYLCPDSTGNMIYVDLTTKLEADYRSFKEVTNIIVIDESSWFITESHLFEYKDDTVKAIKSKTKIISAFGAGKKLFCLLKESGLCELINRNLIQIQGCELFSETIEVKAINILDDNKYLFATGNQGLFVYDSITLIPFDSPANKYLMNNIVSCGVMLNDKCIAYGTERGGIIVLYPDGQFKEVLNEDLGLNDNYVRYLYFHNGALWAALNNGLARIETPSPITFHDLKSGLYGGVTDITRHKNTLYVATYNGLFYQDNKTAKFKQINDINTACWSILSAKGDLLAASSTGVYVVTKESALKINDLFALKLYPLKSDSSTVFIGHTEGLSVIEQNGNKWNHKKNINEIQDEIRDICTGRDDAIWLSTTSNGLIRYYPAFYSVERYDTSNGLPSMMMNRLNTTSLGFIVTTIDGLYSFDLRKMEFQPYTLPGIDSTFNLQWNTAITEDKNGNLWSYKGDETEITRYILKDGKYVKDSKPFSQIENYVIWDIYNDKNNIIWLGGPEGLIRFNSLITKEYSAEFNTIIKRVSTTKDSVLFNGAFIDSNLTAGLRQNDFYKSVLRYENNNIRFVYTACSYHNKNELNYQILLSGFEDEWSEWSTNNHKEYTNLPPGKYVFKVRAIDVFDQISSEAQYKFTILTPWYKQWWSYVLYIGAGVLVFFIIAIWRSRKLVKEKRILENIVKERTEEVVEQKEEIENQSFELSNKNRELERINFIVKAINAEIVFTNLLQSILEKTQIIKGVEKATALVFDKESGHYKFKASFGWDISLMQDIEMSLEDAEKRYLQSMEEIHEDIFFTDNFKTNLEHETLDKIQKPKCILIIVVKIENRVEGFLILENMQSTNAFTEDDINFIKNLKEHIISAFIKTKILEDLQDTLDNLKETQEKLIRQEKLASVGQLTKGIVDRVINPLNYINNFSKLSGDMIVEIKEVIDVEKDKLSEDSYEEIEDITSIISGNLGKIRSHGESAARIVKAMERLLQDKSNNYINTEVNSLLEKKIDISLKELEPVLKDFNIKILRDFSNDAGFVSVMHEEMGQLIKSLLDNAIYILKDKKKNITDFEPEVIFFTKKSGDMVEIHVRDNGSGLPASEIEKIFDPFFTTKPTADGTGLGLYMCKDIVEIHNGILKVNSKEGEFTEFIITLPSFKNE